MLVFLDETFRTAKSGHRLGAICGVAIPEDLFAMVARDVYSMKFSSFGQEFAYNRELKGAKLLHAKNLRHNAKPEGKAQVAFVFDILRYLHNNGLVVFGVVCFEDQLRDLQCRDPVKLEPSYRALIERIDAYMRDRFPKRRAKLVFDDVDHGMNSAAPRVSPISLIGVPLDADLTR